MNAAQIASALRLAIVFLGGVAAIIAAVYGIWIRRPAGIVAQAAKLPDVGMIQAAPSLARSVPSGKVQPVTAEELRDADRMTRG